ncbi:MAG: alpha-amylase family glycosyl hydrolase [Bacteroidales bacterium]|jgi:1,4-alpha-glucan branching enzyme
MNKIGFLLFCLFFGSGLIRAQVVTTRPTFPTENDSVTVIFDATQGTGGLAGYTGDIWAHTGVITNLSTSSTNWKYVVAGWSENTDKAKLKSLGNNLWELKIGPSIRSYYGVPAAEKILKLAFVFRNSNGSKEGKATGGLDIFVDVVETGLNISIVRPDKEFLAVAAGSSIDIQVAATSADSVVLYRDSTRVTGITGNNLNFSLPAGDSGYHFIEARAYGLGIQVSDSFSYIIKGAGNIAELPAGVRDGINYISDQSVVLVLYAPLKEYVFLIGSFNDWMVSEPYLMNQTPDGLRYWLEVNNLEPGKEYQFQYFVDGEIRIADPYSDKISDPWNDVYIDSATYPGLIAYPAGKTTQAVSVIQTARTPFNWKTDGIVAPSNQKLVIYELLVRDFLAAHTFKALTDTLDYLKNLGVNAIELMPVNEFEGNESWGYNPSFYFAVDKYYGPADNFKAFVDLAHSKGMAVIMDMVLNHSYGQSPMVRLYWDAVNNRPAANNPWYNQQSPNTLYSWGYDFNHQSPATQRFVDSVNTYWLKEYRVDGFRFDFTKGFTNTPGDGGAYDASRIAILKRMSDKIRLANPAAIIILEHFADNSEEKVLADYGMLLWGNLNMSYRMAASGWYGGGTWNFSWISYKQRGWTQPNLVGYMESHDEERLMYDCVTSGNIQNQAYNIRDLALALKRMELAANFFIPLPGPKMIWMFGELGYDYSINYNGRVGNKPIRWDYLGESGRKRLNQVYSALNHLKTSQELLSTADYQISFQDTVKSMHLNHATMKATVLGNFGIRSSWTDPGFQHDGWWYEYWTGDSIQITDINGRINLKPGEYRFYTDVKLTKPDIISSIEGHWDPISRATDLSIYPNPANDWLFIDPRVYQGSEVFLRIIDIQGREVLTSGKLQILPGNPIKLDVSRLEEGVYFIRMQGQSGTSVARFVKAGHRQP